MCIVGITRIYIHFLYHKCSTSCNVINIEKVIYFVKYFPDTILENTCFFFMGCYKFIFCRMLINFNFTPREFLSIIQTWFKYKLNFRIDNICSEKCEKISKSEIYYNKLLHFYRIELNKWVNCAWKIKKRNHHLIIAFGTRDLVLVLTRCWKWRAGTSP